jgi:hypothetical protein
VKGNEVNAARARLHADEKCVEDFRWKIGGKDTT